MEDETKPKPKTVYEEVRLKWGWEDIENCPGRSVLEYKYRSDLTKIEPAELLNQLENNKELNLVNIETKKVKSEKCRDPVWVITFPDHSGGLLTYVKIRSEKKGGGISFIHTLNTPSGLSRKTSGLQISL
eukprot:TRINITY_DN4043_c0_g1_i1.p1 TRINITY_DN4043_c0_g1~~TRINITY_DN4043_c0_g1_i1.p1  ORF type:complete len:130 (-),score=32.88 TRINITY_DN4043_c0_g1_i1:23-412(-)